MNLFDTRRQVETQRRVHPRTQQQSLPELGTRIVRRPGESDLQSTRPPRGPSRAAREETFRETRTLGKDRENSNVQGRITAPLALPDGFLVVDECGRIRTANAEAERLFNAAPGALEGVPFDFPLITGQRRDISLPDARVAELACVRSGSGFVVTLRDVTDRWLREKALSGRLERVENQLTRLSYEAHSDP